MKPGMLPVARSRTRPPGLTPARPPADPLAPTDPAGTAPELSVPGAVPGPAAGVVPAPPPGVVPGVAGTKPLDPSEVVEPPLPQQHPHPGG
jgi:hypothetical protein